MFLRDRFRQLLTLFAAFGLAAFVAAPVGATAGTLTISLHSGNGGSPMDPDTLVTYKRMGAGISPLTAADFQEAANGPNAQIYSSGWWLLPLPCDSAAQWIDVPPSHVSSALYAIPFDIPTGCCAGNTTLDFCWASDGPLGNATNPAGLYVNGTPIPSVSGGSRAYQSQVTGIDISSMTHCGRNYLYVYGTEGIRLSGVIFHADITTDCVVPTRETTWGAIKALYRG